MPFDPSKPFEIVEQPEPGFDPNRQFTIVEQPPPATGFDPSKPFEIVEQPPGWLAQRANELARGVVQAGQGIDTAELQLAGSLEEKAKRRLANPEQSVHWLDRMVGKAIPALAAGYQATPEAVTAAAQRDLADAQAMRTRASQSMAMGTAQAAALPRSEAMREFDAAITTGEAAMAILRNPVATVADLTTNSLPSSLGGMALGAVAGAEAGPAGTAAGAFLGSLAPEYAGKMQEVAQEMGVDFRDPKQIEAFFADPQKVAHASTLALRKGIPIAALDAATGGMAGKFLGPALGNGVGAVAKAAGKEAATQLGGAALGETLGQLAAGEQLSGKDILAEVVAEGPQTIQESATNILHERATAAEAQRLDRWAKALAPGGAGEAEAFQQALAADNSRRGVPEPAAPEAPTTLPAAATPTQQGGAGETAAGAPSPQGVEAFENPVGAGYAPAGTFAEVDEVLAAEAAQAEAQRAETERRAQVQAYAARPLPDLVGEALRPRVAELAGKTDLEQHDFWRGMQQVAETLASAQAGRSRDLDLPAVREQAAALFSGAKPALVDAIALKLHGTKPAESVAALRDFHKYAGQQRQPFAAAAQARDAAEAERRAAAQAETAARDQAVQAELARTKQERTSIAKTGRDLDGRVADWTALPDTDLETLAAANEADGFDPDEIAGAQAEIERRSREQGAAQPLSREAQLRLIARYGGINPDHPVHAGEIATIRESEIGRDRKLWRDDGNSLDRLAEQIRQDVQNGPQTEADVLAWLGELAAGRTPKLYERGDVARDDIRFAAAARRADPLTEGITAEQLAAQVQPVEAPAGAWSDDNRANNQQLRALLAPLRGQTIAGVEITREGIKHLARLQENPLEFRVAAQLPALLSSSLPVGRPESTGERGPTIQRRIAAAVIDGISVPVRITTKTFAGRTTLHHLETAERHSGISRRRAAERLEDRIESGVPSPTVADLLPDVKPQPDGTYTARFAQAAAPADQFVDANKMVDPAADPAARRKIARLEKTFRRIMPALFRDVEVRIDNVGQALAAEGHETPEGVEAVYLPRPRAQRDLIVLAADVALRDDGRTGLARMLHESVHAYWRMLSPETRAALRRLYDRDLSEQWSPLWRDGKLNTEVSQDDILSGDELGLEEWFSELMAALNAEWATRRGSSRVPGWVQDLATTLREILAQVWRTVAQHKGLRGDALDQFLNRDFRAFLTRGVSAQRTAAAGAAFARNAQAQGGAPKIDKAGTPQPASAPMASGDGAAQQSSGSPQSGPNSVEFRKWFRGSQVVTPTGEPLLVFHGTDAEFDRFDRSKSADGLLWFSADKDAIARGDSGASGRGRIIAAYLSAKKLAGWTEYEKYTTDQLIREGYDGIKLDSDYVVFEPSQIHILRRPESSRAEGGASEAHFAQGQVRFAQRQDPEAAGTSRERFEAADAKVREIEARLDALAESQTDDTEEQGRALRQDLAAARRERSKAYVEANATRVEADPVSQALNTNPRVRALREDIIRLTAAIDRAQADGQPRDELLDRRTTAQEEIEALRRQAERSLFPAAPAELPVDFGDANPPRNTEPPKIAQGAPDPEHLRPVRFDDFSGFTGPQLTERLAHLRAMTDNLPPDLENGERLQFLARLVRETREELESRRAGLEAEAEQAVAAPSATPDQQAREAEALAAERESAARDALDAEAAAAIPDMPAETYPVRDDVAEVASAVSAGTLAPTGRIAQWFASLGELLKGFRGAIPELPVFGEKARGFQNFREGMRLMASVPEVVRREAQEIVDDIVAPLRAHSTTAARDAQARLQQLHRRLAAEALPERQAILRRLIRETETELGTDPWWIFQNVILYGDLFTRSRLYRRDDGSPIGLPGGLNPAEAEHLFKQWLQRAHAHPQKTAILEARARHKAFVARIGADLKERGFVFAEGSNANYFPHVLLEKWDGNTANVKIGTAEDFRGYLITPVGSIKPIETDYLKAMYYHAAQVLAHNRHADIVRDYVASEDIRPKLIAEAAELTEQIRKKEPDAAPVTWRAIYHKRYAADFDLYTPDPGKIPLHPEMVINRDLLSKRLGLVLGSGPIAEELKKHGLTDIPLRPEEVQEMLTAGATELWVLPKQMADALRGIAARQSRADKLLQKVLAAYNGFWKKNTLFAPWNWFRFEFNNMVSDLEKILVTDPAVAKGLIDSGKEVYAFLSGDPDASADVREAFRLGVLDTLTAAEVNALRQQRPFEAWETSGDRNARVAVNRLTSFFSSSRWNTMGWSKLREATFRYAKFKADLERLRHGATPKYAGAYWKNVEALRRVGAPEEIAEYTKAGRAFSRGGPGPLLSAQPYVLTWQEAGRQREEAFASQAGRAKRREELESRQREADAALLARKAAAISRATFGDYGELTPNGNALRRLFIPFYAWTETNFRYHANLLRNLRDQVREGEIGAGAAASKFGLSLASTGARAVVGLFLRLLLPYVAVGLWNALASGVDDDELSEEDRRRFHLRLGHEANGKPVIVYLNMASADVAKWFSGNRAAGLVADVAAGRTDLGTAADSFARNLLPDFANNTLGSLGPVVKVPYTLASGKSTFPDVTDQSTIPSYDMRRVILGQMTDQTVADWIERAVNKDYVSPRSMGEWAQQAILQVRRRDPESWAFYAIKDKAAQFEEAKTGRRENRAAYDAPEAQVLRQYRRAIYQADVPTAMRMYQRLLALGYTAERFEASIRSQDPLHGLPTALRRSFVESLSTYEREQLRKAYRYYLRMQELEGSGRRLFPRAKLTPAGRQMWGQYDRSQVLADEIARAQATQNDEAAAEQRIDRELAEALRRN